MSLFGSTEETETKLGKDGSRILNPLIDHTQSLLGNTPEWYGFDTVAGMDRYQQQGIDALGNGIGGQAGQAMFNSGLQGMGLVNSYFGNQQQAPQIQNLDISEFYNSDLVNQRTQASADAGYDMISRYLGNQVASGDVASGNDGSRSAMIRGLALGEAATGQAQIAGDIRGQEIQRATQIAQQNAQLQQQMNQLRSGDMQMFGNLAGQNLQQGAGLYDQNALNQIQAGGLNQQQQQRMIDAQKEQHLWDNTMGWQSANNYSAINAPAWNLTNSKTTSTPSMASVGMGIAGAVGGMMTGGASTALMGAMGSMGGGGGGGAMGGAPSNANNFNIGGRGDYMDQFNSNFRPSGY